jgi:hypothetical protein
VSTGIEPFPTFWQPQLWNLIIKTWNISLSVA